MGFFMKFVGIKDRNCYANECVYVNENKETSISTFFSSRRNKWVEVPSDMFDTGLWKRVDRPNKAITTNDDLPNITPHTEYTILTLGTITIVDDIGKYFTIPLSAPGWALLHEAEPYEVQKPDPNEKALLTKKAVGTTLQTAQVTDHSLDALPIKKEITMSKILNKKLEFYGVDIYTMDKQELLNSINIAEKRIEEFKAVKAESKYVAKQIAKLEKAITKMVKRLDK